MVVGRDADEQRIGADHFGSTFAQVADHDAVVVRAWRLHQQSAQQRLRWVGHLQQLHGRENAEHAPQHGEAADCQQ